MAVAKEAALKFMSRDVVGPKSRGFVDQICCQRELETENMWLMRWLGRVGDCDIVDRSCQFEVGSRSNGGDGGVGDPGLSTAQSKSRPGAGKGMGTTSVLDDSEVASERAEPPRLEEFPTSDGGNYTAHHTVADIHRQERNSCSYSRLGERCRMRLAGCRPLIMVWSPSHRLDLHGHDRICQILMRLIASTWCPSQRHDGAVVLHVAAMYRTVQYSTGFTSSPSATTPPFLGRGKGCRGREHVVGRRGGPDVSPGPVPYSTRCAASSQRRWVRRDKVVDSRSSGLSCRRGPLLSRLACRDGHAGNNGDDQAIHTAELGSPGFAIMSSAVTARSQLRMTAYAGRQSRLAPNAPYPECIVCTVVLERCHSLSQPVPLPLPLRGTRPSSWPPAGNHTSLQAVTPRGSPAPLARRNLAEAAFAKRRWTRGLTTAACSVGAASKPCHDLGSLLYRPHDVRPACQANSSLSTAPHLLEYMHLDLHRPRGRFSGMHDIGYRGVSEITNIPWARSYDLQRTGLEVKPARSPELWLTMRNTRRMPKPIFHRFKYCSLRADAGLITEGESQHPCSYHGVWNLVRSLFHHDQTMGECRPGSLCVGRPAVCHEYTEQVCFRLGVESSKQAVASLSCSVATERSTDKAHCLLCSMQHGSPSRDNTYSLRSGLTLSRLTLSFADTGDSTVLREHQLGRARKKRLRRPFQRQRSSAVLLNWADWSDKGLARHIQPGDCASPMPGCLPIRRLGCSSCHTSKSRGSFRLCIPIGHSYPPVVSAATALPHLQREQRRTGGFSNPVRQPRASTSGYLLVYTWNGPSNHPIPTKLAMEQPQDWSAISLEHPLVSVNAQIP
nr:hypothetical protein CFP56_21963 [Quercus suber]